MRQLVAGPRPEFIAASLVADVVQAGFGSAAAMWLTARRIPDLTPSNLLVRTIDGQVTARALVRARGAVLATDTLADHPELVTLVDVEEGRSWLRERIVAIVTPLIPAVAPYAKRTLRHSAVGEDDSVVHAQRPVGEHREGGLVVADHDNGAALLGGRAQ